MSFIRNLSLNLTHIFFFFCVPSLGFTDFTGEIFAYATGIFFFFWGGGGGGAFIFGPTIKIGTFRGWCMLDVFLLLAFTRLGHESQDLLSPWDRQDLDLYSYPKRVWGELIQDP